MKIVADAQIPFIKEYFSADGELILKPGRLISHEDVKEADILLVRSVTRVDAALLANTRVKFVGSVTAGADHVDAAWLQAAGIVFCTAAGFNAPPVADYVVSVIAALQREKQWLHRPRRAGIIGVGHVGRLVKERLTLLGIETILCDPLRAEQEADFHSVPLDAFTELDLITLHVPLTKHSLYPTYHFINKTVLERQRPECVLINASRGAVIHTEALLQYGKHLHWCLDVFEGEPVINPSLLSQALIATPHIAGYSVQSKIRGIDMIYRAVCEQGLIHSQSMAPLDMACQQLVFSGTAYQWQDIVLAIFNPLAMTAMMREKLLGQVDHGQLFDEMRNQFNDRYEFAYTKILGAALAAADTQLLQAFGIQLG